MERIILEGNIPLKGEINVSGAKNAAVAVLPAALLSQEKCILENMPNISDMSFMYNIIKIFGGKIFFLDNSTIEIDPSGISPVLSSDLVEARNMRASCYFLGVFLAKFGYARLPIPGGCNFGVRPIDQHIKGFESIGAKCFINENFIEIKANKLVGANIYLDIVSVGATINIMLAATLAEGTTVIENAAKEPHVVDVANFLNNIGANIIGAGTDVIKINGVSKLYGTRYSIIPDQIEAGTFMAATFSTLGNVNICNIIPKHLESIIAKFEEMGASITCYDDSLNIKAIKRPNFCNIKTMPYPGFPTDMQPQIAALLIKANGNSIINESIWQNRFKYILEILKFGAKIKMSSNIAIIEGVENTYGANVQADDLRAGAALIIAGLGSIGVTQISKIEFIERGYEDIVGKLSKLGASIKKVKCPASILVGV